MSIFVEDINDNPPVFEHDGIYTAHISEESGPDTEVVVVTATDDDEGANAQIMYVYTFIQKIYYLTTCKIVNIFLLIRKI